MWLSVKISDENDWQMSQFVWWLSVIIDKWHLTCCRFQSHIYTIGVTCPMKLSHSLFPLSLLSTLHILTNFQLQHLSISFSLCRTTNIGHYNFRFPNNWSKLIHNEFSISDELKTKFSSFRKFSDRWIWKCHSNSPTGSF